MATFIQNQFEKNFITTSVDYVFNWARKSAIWPLTFGLGLLRDRDDRGSSTRGSISRGSAPRCSGRARGNRDLMIVAGTRYAENGAGAEADLGPDAGPEVVHLDGRVLDRRRTVQHLRGAAGRRQDLPGGCLCHADARRVRRTCSTRC